ncbi:MAG TPA: hypothetical protein VMU05_23865, partial [Dongiaceae bacterium]|nr:hypothetical protein [Dongiaceae bacterium]
EVVTLILATVGTVLGLVITYVQLNTRRVRLKVIPSSALVAPAGALTNVNDHFPGGTLAIEVVNLSAFPVTVAEVGYTLPARHRAVIRKPLMADGKPFPRRLEPRESCTAYVTDLSSVPKNIQQAYARTACDETRFGNSRALKAFRSNFSQPVDGDESDPI